MIGILGGMGTQAGLDFCNKLAMLNRGKIDQKYPLFILYNKSNIPGRPENLNKYNKVFKKGDIVTFEPGSNHSSYTKNGCLILVFMRAHNKAINSARKI